MTPREHRASLRTLSQSTDEAIPVAVPSLNTIDRLDLPDLGDRYGRPVVEVMERTEKALIDDKVDKLDRLLDKSLAKLDELLDVDVDISDPENAKIIAAQLTAAQTVVSTVLKADDSRLRKRQADNLGRLLDVMRSEEAKLISS